MYILENPGAEALHGLTPASILGLPAYHAGRSDEWVTNALAQAGALAALEDEAHLEASVAYVARQRARLTAGLRALGMRCAPSVANFLFVEVGEDSARLAENLLRLGVLVKPWVEPPWSEWLRVSIGSASSCDAFLETMRRRMASSRMGAKRD